MPAKETSTLVFGVGFSALYTLSIWLAGPKLGSFRSTLLEDQGFSWYYWKLPHPTVITRMSCWLSYMLHQGTIWYLIYRSQSKKLKYSDSLHFENWLCIAANALFALWHLLQTHLFYDGLAQDTSILSSQGSVIFLLIIVLIMENDRRGMFFGYKAPLSSSAMHFFKKYHGYYFSWAVVYTFWYHPCETSTGHLGGFFYTGLLMVQGSLFYTRSHLNKFWKLSLEMIVTLHGTVVAINQVGFGGFWPMFFFGFMALFVITQMHSLGWSFLTKSIILTLYTAAVLFMYNIRGWEHINEPFRIPVIDYIGVFVVTWLTSGGLALYRKLLWTEESNYTNKM
jgi:hypothetical protein